MYRKKTKGLLKHWDFILWDMLCLQVAFILAYFIRLGFENPYASALYRTMALYIELADIIVLFLFNTLKDVLKRGYYKEFTKTIKHTIIVGLLGIAYLFAIQQSHGFSRIILVLMVLIYFVLTYFVRVLWKNYLIKYKKIRGKRNLIIVTPLAQAQAAVENVRDYDLSGLKVAGVIIVDNDMIGQEIAGALVVSNRENLISYICHEWIDEILLISSPDFPILDELMEDILKTGIVIHMYLPEIKEDYGYKKQIGQIGQYTVLTSTMNSMTQSQAFAKRTLDIIGGLVGCFITGILFIFIAPAVYRKSPGKIFYAHTRIGLNGKQFKMYKSVPCILMQMSARRSLWSKIR